MRIRALRSRNVVLRMEWPSRSFIYKEFKPNFPLGAHRGEREYRILRLLMGLKGAPVGNDLAPNLIDYDEAAGRMLLETIDSGETPQQRLLATPLVARSTESIGERLAELHSIRRDDPEIDPLPEAE